MALGAFRSLLAPAPHRPACCSRLARSTLVYPGAEYVCDHCGQRFDYFGFRLPRERAA